MYFIIDFVRKRESSDDFAGNCITKWDVWRPNFRLIFFIGFVQVTAGVGVFLRSFYQL